MNEEITKTDNLVEDNDSSDESFNPDKEEDNWDDEENLIEKVSEDEEKGNDNEVKNS